MIFQNSSPIPWKTEKLGAKPNGWGAIIVNINRKKCLLCFRLVFSIEGAEVKFPVFSLRAIKPI